MDLQNVGELYVRKLLLLFGDKLYTQNIKDLSTFTIWFIKIFIHNKW